jgi:ABC-type uncharacterized transport system auxiliary subunit
MRPPFLLRLSTVFLPILTFAACAHVRYPTNYVLNFPPPSPSSAAPHDMRGALAIQEFQCPQYLCEGRIVYRSSPEEIGSYEFHRWAMNPRDMITQSVADRIRSEALFHSVVLKGTGVEPAYVLKGNIERLEEVDEGRDVRVVCTISAELLDTQTKSIIWTHTASETVAVRDRKVAGVVSSLSTAARMAVDNLVKSLAETLPSARSEQITNRLGEYR